MPASLYAFPVPVSQEPAIPDRQPFTFDMTQPDAAGMVLIEACVPQAMAAKFLSLLIAFTPAI